jgi:tetratricopeptide (TPR) repeat protein/glutathione synthase/RimK-type ligase-like ATP-grasp enzyme
LAQDDKRSLLKALAALDAKRAIAALSLDAEVERAGLLTALERTDEARAAYLAVISADPTHFAALNNFGSLLYQTDFRTAAHTVFAQAVLHHPDNPIGHVNLANTLMYAGELEAARGHLEKALKLDSDHAPAHRRLSELFHQLGDLEGMRRHRALGFAGRPMRRYPYLGDDEGVHLLVLTSTPGADMAWMKLVNNRLFAVTTLAAAYHDPATPLPPHHLILNAIGDADLAYDDLHAADGLCAGSAAAVLNPPANVLATARRMNAERLAGLSGVVTPVMAQLAKTVLSGAGGEAVLTDHGLGFPLLLRSPGFHTGQHFVRVEHAAQLGASADALPGDELIAMQYLDARGPDGCARKYRVMMIDGALYPLHLAVSHDWKVHYFSGAMRDEAAFQAEEARFLNAMPDVLGPSGMAALEAIQATLGLDYAGLDFGIGPNGELLVFEANAVMNIIPPDASPQWDYRRPAIDRAIAAARRLLVNRARRSP